jgi:hypothetical protein
VLTAAVKTGT